MNKVIGFLLTRTKLLRFVAVLACGWLVGSGVIAEKDRPQIEAAVLVVLTGVVSLWIEGKKDAGAKRAQEEIGAKPDGWFGPRSQEQLRKTIPGGEYNPAAEIRKAVPVHGRGGLFKG